MQHDVPPESSSLPPTQPIWSQASTPPGDQYYQPFPQPAPPPPPPPLPDAAPAQPPISYQAAAQPPSYQTAVPGQWVTFSQLRNHPLVNINEGREIGRVADVLLDEQRRVIQAFATKKGILRGPLYVPNIKAAIGVDAITFQPGALEGQDTSWLDKLPRASELLGARVLSQSGQVLGHVDNIRFQQNNGLLLALEINPERTGIMHRLRRGRRLLPASSIISYGPDAIIARDSVLPEL